MSTVVLGGAPKCIKCNKAVYFTEQVVGPGGFYHKPCLACTECNKRLDSTLLTESNGKPYCKSCYSKLFGPKGFKLGTLNDTGMTQQNASVAQSVKSVALQSPTSPKSLSSLASPKTAHEFFNKSGCPSCNKAVYFAEQIIGPGGIKYHKLCFKCVSCNKLLESGSELDNDGKLYCRVCHGKSFGPKGYGYSNTLNTERAG